MGAKLSYSGDVRELFWITAYGRNRAGVSWANVLDWEAVERSGGDINTLGAEDFIEALARRIAHHAGREVRLIRLKLVRRGTKCEDQCLVKELKSLIQHLIYHASVCTKRYFVKQTTTS